MTKFKQIKKTDSVFNIHNISSEFNEYFEYVFISNKKIFFVFRENIINHENIKGHVIEYFSTYICIFLNIE